MLLSGKAIVSKSHDCKKLSTETDRSRYLFTTSGYQPAQKPVICLTYGKGGLNACVKAKEYLVVGQILEAHQCRLPEASLIQKL